MMSCVVCFHLQFDGQPAVYENSLHFLNIAFTILFTIECILKLLAFGVRVSFYLTTVPWLVAGHTQAQ